MRKLLYVMFTLLTVGFISCSYAEKTNTVSDSDTIVMVDSVDTVAIDSI